MCVDTMIRKGFLSGVSRKRLEIYESRLRSILEPAMNGRVVAIDLIIAGARGDSLVRRLALGSVADRLLKTARCSVLVAR